MKSVGDQRGYRELLVIISLGLSGNAMMQSLTTDLLGLLRYAGTTSILVSCVVKKHDADSHSHFSSIRARFIEK